MPSNPKASYKGYLFDCEPMPLTDGRFGAQIIISKDGVWEPVTSKRFPALENFPTEDEAIEFSKQWGKQWVDDQG
jgi:hypothetical protein